MHCVVKQVSLHKYFCVLETRKLQKAQTCVIFDEELLEVQHAGRQVQLYTYCIGICS